jgi:hypothetical protein
MMEFVNSNMVEATNFPIIFAFRFVNQFNMF